MKITSINVLRGEKIDKISFVGKPANKDNINTCSIEFCAINSEQKTIDVVLINALQKIYRSEPERFYYFTIEGLKRITKNTDFTIVPFTIEHDDTQKVAGVTIESAELETTSENPLQLRATLKIDNAELWNNIESGIYNGVSIEAVVVETTIIEFETEEELFSKIEELPIETKKDIFYEFNTYEIN